MSLNPKAIDFKTLKKNNIENFLYFFLQFWVLIFLQPLECASSIK